MENKQQILDLLLPALQATRDLHTLEGLRYDAEHETVWCAFADGALPVNVAMDSGIAMIRDILRQID